MSRPWARACRRVLTIAWALAVVAPAWARAQTPPLALPAAQEGPVVDISPRGAFLRAMALPGWGHAAIGAHTRGAFYFAAETAMAYTLIRSRIRLNEARDRLAFRESFLRAQLAAEGVTAFQEIESRLDDDAVLSELRSLEDSRAAQQEDMVALGIFLVFLSGADAYVSAHLSRFPDPLDLEAQPVGGGRVELALRLRVR